ncbi:LOW QUALITY PROTEIN: hypothetical protein JCM24511_08964 [Saitozyma sp. JCM 24511]|nr:LOW QUALITY PROTEIN: hypothetical protein JCM24511_08964 [Saitozyma sp. JCM 24511]
MCDRWGKRNTIWIGSVIIIAGAIWNGLCTSSGQFIGVGLNGLLDPVRVLIWSARLIVGAGGTITKIAAPALTQELAHPRLRSVLGTMYYCFYYVGAITSSCLCMSDDTCLRLSNNLQVAGLHINGEWGWRLPMIFQGAGPIIVLCVTCMMPESPRWLISKGRNAEAKAMLTKYHANGLEGDPLVEWEYAEIVAVLHQETITPKSHYTSSRHLETDAGCYGSPRGPATNGPGCADRLAATSLQSSNSSASPMQPTSQESTPVWVRNLSLWRDFRDLTRAVAIFNLIVSLTSAVNIERAGRRKMFITSMLGMIGSYAIVMGLSAGFALKGNVAMGTAAIPFLFVFNGFYDIAWTPITPYHLRTKALSIFMITQNIGAAFNTFVNPIALASLQWRYYGVYIALDFGWLAFIYFLFPETKNLTIEEVSLVFDYDRKGAREKAALEAEQVIDKEFAKGNIVDHTDDKVMAVLEHRETAV